MIEGDKVGNVTLQVDANKLMEVMLYGLQNFSLTHLQEARNGPHRRITIEALGGPAFEATPSGTNNMANNPPLIKAHG